MPHKGYVHPPGTPSAMKREFEFPKFNFQPDPEGYVGQDYKKRKKVTARGHTLQSRKRAERLRGREFMKKFRGKTRPIIV